MEPLIHIAPSGVPGFLSGGGQSGQLIREYDWSKTPLGLVQTWPQSLRSALSICLNSNFPIAIYWGKELTLLYNDAWSPIPGIKHPWALGRPAIEVWPEIWQDIEPQFKKAFQGEPGGSKDALLPMQRHGYTEECYFDFTFTPIYGETGKIEGVFNAVSETTYRLISERRNTFLKRLSLHIAACKTSEDVFKKGMAFLKEASIDIPFASVYTLSADSMSSAGNDFSAGNAVLQFTTLMDKELTFQQKPWPFEQIVQSGQPLYIDTIDAYFSEVPKGYWPEKTTEGYIVPLRANSGIINGFLVCGLSARHRFDDDYQSFVEAIVSTFTAVLHTIFSLEEERQKAEALAEIDRAKTTFFSNISHEFRTPLTLLLGPIEDTLNDPATLPQNKARMEVAYRNILRMQKLVNTLLEFSRIEAGRVEGRFSRVNIGTLTEDLASVFRSAIEKAGMQLTVIQDPIVSDVYVDIDMWEKIILNLLSNAFKYSQEGTISLHIGQIGNQIQVSVADTGIGIAPDQLDKIFNRFHRIENHEGRSQEGTGIGLAMVKELVKLHHGSITVQSKVGSGSVFTITIPVGKDHLPADKIVAIDPLLEGGIIPDSAWHTGTIHSEAFVQEAWKWLPTEETLPSEEQSTENQKADDPKYLAAITGSAVSSSQSYKSQILLADDNADMREYVERLLSDRFTVLTAINGEDALQKILRFKPELVLSDIMMPKMDGFELLRQIRNHPEIKNIPVIFLSARAGEEAKVEGLDAGVDDYLVKPFSAKELIGRVSNQIRINQVRRETEQQFYQLFLQAPALINVLKGPEHRYEFFHPKNKEIFGNKDFTGMTIRQALPELQGQGIFEMLDEVYQNGKSIILNERHVDFLDENGKLVEKYLNIIYQPWYDIKGQIQGILNFALDVTETVQSRKKIEISENRFRSLIMQAPVSIAVLLGPDRIVDIVNNNYLQLIGKERESFVGKPLWDALPEVKEQGFDQLLQQVMDTGMTYTGYEQELLLLRHGKQETMYVNFIYSPLKDIDDNTIGIMVVATEVTEQVRAHRKIKESEQALNEMANAIPQLAWVAGPNLEVLYFNNRLSEFKGAEKLPDGNWTWKGMVHTEDLSRTESLWNAASRTGENFQCEHRIQLKDGTYRWHLSRGIPQRNQEGEVIKWFGTTTDIHIAREQASILEAEVKKRTLELQQLNLSLHKSNEDLQQFAHVASHDLKEPVRKIKTFTGRLQDEYSHTIPEQGKAFLEKIQTATNRMVSMVDGVLAYSKLNANEQPIEAIDLNQTLINIVTDLELLIQQKDAVITWDLLPVIQGAPVLIYQLFYNLINNSLKFSKKDQKPVISITSSFETTNGDFVRIQVADNGIGFTDDNAEKIFNTFTRLNSKDEYEGTGLGLALCKKIVERHQGSIFAISQKDQGATFIISLPVTQSQESL
ncbi:ATP-binding protein [Xanthocytophaga agilis]|uniref:histidine kinase n=1 Tax=Xanthocytophaga agilis TaxID=3048010 RepID=A0AAE3UG62_9BACT|nr:ATP-binding protein [Xanthocytophaga agilis]MDJ1502112.1 ATP-binding protein [Xanthocytophaga agilis]